MTASHRQRSEMNLDSGPSATQAPVDISAKLKHLDLVQGVITRLATNSFALKRWCVLMVSAVLVLVSRDPRPEYALIAAVAVAMFWTLDSWFLGTEHLYRDLYDDVRQRSPEAIDFSLTPEPSHLPWSEWRRVAGSATLRVFYGGLLTLVVLLCLLLFKEVFS